MATWLLSGHNPRETFGVSYPISVTYAADFTAGRQMVYLIETLTGGGDSLDLELPPMLTVDGRMYLNMAFFSHNLAPLLPFDATAFGAPKEMVKAEGRVRLTTRLLLPFRLGGVFRPVARARREVIPRYRKKLDEVYWRLREQLSAGSPWEQQLAVLERLFEPGMLDDAAAFARGYALGSIAAIAVAKVVSERAPQLLNLVVGRGTSTAQLGDRVWELRQIAAECGPEVTGLLQRGETDLQAFRSLPSAAPFLQALDSFLRAYGHRAFRYGSEFEATRLADQPELVLLSVGGLLAEEEPPAVRAEAARQASYRALQAMAPPRRLFWRLLLRWESTLLEQREQTRDTLELHFSAYGLAAQLLSRHYFPEQSPDTLWLYTFSEFIAFGQSQGTQRVAADEIARRRAELEHNRRLPTPPELIWYDPATKQWWPVQEAAAEKGPPASVVRLQGIGASAGSGPVEGVALVTDDAQEAAERLLKMTGPVVLIAYVTDPVWSSLFRRLTAVVTVMGGAISHAAVVARENGIPAVVGVAEATGLIPDGQWVRVDGAAGLVEVIERGSAPAPTTVGATP